MYSVHTPDANLDSKGRQTALKLKLDSGKQFYWKSLIWFLCIVYSIQYVR